MQSEESTVQNCLFDLAYTSPDDWTGTILPGCRERLTGDYRELHGGTLEVQISWQVQHFVNQKCRFRGWHSSW